MTDPPERIAWLEEPFLEHLEFERNLSPATLKAYRRELARFVDHTATIRSSPRDVTASDIRDWIAHLWQRRLQPRSLERALSAIRTIWIRRHFRIDPPRRHGVDRDSFWRGLNTH